MKPIIGVVEWPYYDKDEDKVYEVFTSIIEWINRCGGRPIGIFPSQVEGFLYKSFVEMEKMTEIEQKELKESVSICDAIIKPGALKIYPYEKFIYDACAENRMPYLGICAGMQMMAAYQQEMIKNIKNDSDICHYSKDDYCHSIKLLDNTILKKIINKDEIMVNSRHNYHILNSGIQRVSAIAQDGIIEAIESNDDLFQLGLQWHPELLSKDDENSQIIFGEFIEAAKTYQKRKK